MKVTPAKHRNKTVNSSALHRKMAIKLIGTSTGIHRQGVKMLVCTPIFSYVMLFNCYLLHDEIDSILIFLKCLGQPVATFERIWIRNCQQAKTIPVQCLFRMLPSKHDHLPRNWLKCHLPKSRVSRVSCFTKNMFQVYEYTAFRANIRSMRGAHATA